MSETGLSERSLPAVPVVAIVAAHLTCNALAVRDWVGAGSLIGLGDYDVTAVLVSAAVVALAGTATAVAAFAATRRQQGDGSFGFGPVRPWCVALGVAVALLLPPAWDAAQESRAGIPLGRTALLYALPWALGLAAAGWLRGRAAITAGATVAVSALACAALVGTIHVVAYLSVPHGAD